MPTSLRPSHGPFRAENMPPGSDWELSNGVPVYCSPVRNRGGNAQGIGAAAIFSDPAAENFGTEVGVSTNPGMLRAPDVAVFSGPVARGWAETAPPLAIEYADSGQDENELKKKIGELLEAGTLQIWVVRMTGPRRVEVYTPASPVRVVASGDVLVVPGVLQNPVPVEALWDRDAARRHALRNLLSDHGYRDLDALRQEAEREGRKEGEREGRKEGEREGRREAVAALQEAILTVEGASSDGRRAEVLAEADLGRLQGWLAAATERVRNRA